MIEAIIVYYQDHSECLCNPHLDSIFSQLAPSVLYLVIVGELGTIIFIYL